MWPFKKKTKKTEAVHVGSLQDIETVLASVGIKPPRPKAKNSKAHDFCPDVLVATSSCICSTCPRVNHCAVESMSRSAGCVSCFPIYCTVKDNMREIPTHGIGNIILKDWVEMLYRRHGIPGGNHVISSNITMGENDGKEERTSRTELLTGCGGDSKQDIHERGDV